jgi:hypothetical protein
MSAPQDVLERLKGVFAEKNEDYGNSWEKVGVIKRIMADEEGPNVVFLYPDGTYTTSPDESKDNDAIEAVQLSDTPTNDSTFEQNADDLITRLLDKLIRAYNLTLLKDEPALDNESTVDAWEDLTGYSSMGTSLVENARNNE